MKTRIVSIVLVLSWAAFPVVFPGCSGEQEGPAPMAEGEDGDRTLGEESAANAEGGAGAEADLKPQETCPVMGGKINRDVYADYRGKRVYFCCGSCPPEFKKNPEKYLAKLRKRGEEPEDAPP